MNASPDNAILGLFIRPRAVTQGLFFSRRAPLLLLTPLGSPRSRRRRERGGLFSPLSKENPRPSPPGTRARHSRVNEDYQAPEGTESDTIHRAPVNYPVAARSHKCRRNYKAEETRIRDLTPTAATATARTLLLLFYLCLRAGRCATSSGPQKDRENRRVRAVSLVDPRGPMKSHIAREIVGTDEFTGSRQM